jgi:outer membrane protein
MIKQFKKLLLFAGCLACLDLSAQQVYDLQSCLKFALENNHSIRKTQFDREKSAQARREVIGALLPQINGSANLNDNLKKAQFIMPNFMNDFLPESMRDPNAAKYMIIAMGTNYSTGIGATLNQQILNFSLFNTLEIVKTAENLSALAIESKEEDIIAQTAGLFYAVQVTDYAVDMFGKSLSIMDTLMKTMEVSYANGLVKKVDLDRLKVTRTNMLTQRSSIENAISVQKNLLKLQMGLDMNQPVSIEKINLAFFEKQPETANDLRFELNAQTPYRIMQVQQNLGLLQRKSAVFESLPVLTAMANYNYTGVCDKFFTGETNYWYSSSMIGLNLRILIFGGLSRTAKIRQADAEIMKIREDAATLEQSMSMAFLNARLKLEDNRKTINTQQENMSLAGEVYRVSESNYAQGLASMSDVLNANASLIQSQISYADALNNFMKAWIDLRKANGTIKDIVE